VQGRRRFLRRERKKEICREKDLISGYRVVTGYITVIWGVQGYTIPVVAFRSIFILFNVGDVKLVYLINEPSRK
jgi:hypothetical protein